MLQSRQSGSIVRLRRAAPMICGVALSVALALGVAAGGGLRPARRPGDPGPGSAATERRGCVHGQRHRGRRDLERRGERAGAGGARGPAGGARPAAASPGPGRGLSALAAGREPADRRLCAELRDRQRGALEHALHRGAEGRLRPGRRARAAEPAAALPSPRPCRCRWWCCPCTRPRRARACGRTTIRGGRPGPSTWTRSSCSVWCCRWGIWRISPRCRWPRRRPAIRWRWPISPRATAPRTRWWSPPGPRAARRPSRLRRSGFDARRIGREQQQEGQPLSLAVGPDQPLEAALALAVEQIQASLDERWKSANLLRFDQGGLMLVERADRPARRLGRGQAEPGAPAGGERDHDAKLCPGSCGT